MFLILLGGLIAPFGDLLGSKIGKARFSFKIKTEENRNNCGYNNWKFYWCLSIGLLLLFSEEFRQRLFVDIPFLQKLWTKVKRRFCLWEERKKLENKINNKEKELSKLKRDIKEFRREMWFLKRANFIYRTS